MYLRFACQQDIKQLSKLHWRTSKHFISSTDFILGRGYLEQYYRILLAEKKSTILCAENESGQVIGFLSATLDYYGEHKHTLYRKRFLLLLASIPGLLVNLRSLLSLLSRQRTVKQQLFGEKTSEPEAHILFWQWDSNDRTPGGAISLLQDSLSILKTLGARRIKFEVDGENEKVLKIHLILGAKILHKINLKDNMIRYILEYVTEGN